MEDEDCPICCDRMDYGDLNIFPCPCNFQLCSFCLHNLMNEESPNCPACRRRYDPKDLVRKRSPEELKQYIKELKQQKTVKKNKEKARKANLNSVCVVRRTLVYMIGIPSIYATEEILRRPEYLGQFGEIPKMVVQKPRNNKNRDKCSAHITFAREEDALACILGTDCIKAGGGTLRSAFGTTKYCSFFLRDSSCAVPDCLFLHEMAPEADTFPREDSHTITDAFFAASRPQAHITNLKSYRITWPSLSSTHPATLPPQTKLVISETPTPKATSKPKSEPLIATPSPNPTEPASEPSEVAQEQKSSKKELRSDYKVLEPKKKKFSKAIKVAQDEVKEEKKEKKDKAKYTKKEEKETNQESKVVETIAEEPAAAKPELVIEANAEKLPVSEPRNGKKSKKFKGKNDEPEQPPQNEVVAVEENIQKKEEDKKEEVKKKQKEKRSDKKGDKKLKKEEAKEEKKVEEKKVEEKKEENVEPAPYVKPTKKSKRKERKKQESSTIPASEPVEPLPVASDTLPIASDPVVIAAEAEPEQDAMSTSMVDGILKSDEDEGPIVDQIAVVEHVLKPVAAPISENPSLSDIFRHIAVTPSPSSSVAKAKQQKVESSPSEPLLPEPQPPMDVHQQLMIQNSSVKLPEVLYEDVANLLPPGPSPSLPFMPGFQQEEFRRQPIFYNPPFQQPYYNPVPPMHAPPGYSQPTMQPQWSHPAPPQNYYNQWAPQQHEYQQPLSHAWPHPPHLDYPMPPPPQRMEYSSHPPHPADRSHSSPSRFPPHPTEQSTAAQDLFSNFIKAPEGQMAYH